MKQVFSIFVFGFIALCGTGCYSPTQSQRYFAQAAAADPVLEPLHETALYTVYYDHALKRCVLHSAHTWGENGGGGGGTGIGVSVFPCDPARLKARATEIRGALKAGKRLVLPPPATDTRQSSSPGAMTPMKEGE